MQQTAVEYLKEHFQNLINNDEKGLYKLLFEQAVEMERQQIIEAYTHDRLLLKITAEQYYNETFKKE